MTTFSYLTLTGIDADKFLQGQLTINTANLHHAYRPTAICNLKGRVQFSLWICRIEDGFGIVLPSELSDDFQAHLKKYGAFSKITASTPTIIYPSVQDGTPTFSHDASQHDWEQWAKLSIEQGNYWLNKTTSEQFQPQELRLHQRGGVNYDKGCYLGQEIVARLWFKASPKTWLHRVAINNLNDKVQIVNQFNQEALVVARPEDLADATILSLPKALQQSVARD
ncbi:YgfZ/GcvT domain-containing protein [Moraxella nasicaprae]|uniref:Folate-binding Fe/S cluster repair protein n=1 Tax=Moraxella nasicaprae TaxID=2904122 RepID=A0ABY6F639_9GAMM|nr:folate-binding Fe/S cluster repair protein [Moraxella nasicaprae]UXZ05562.1 folate-binding Fe/S cluster repair protein [Moraxella nasicaprae]